MVIYYIIFCLDEAELQLESNSMAGVLIDAGGAMANTTLPEKSDVFDKPSPDNLHQGVNGEDTLWDENDKLVPEAQPYSESKSILKANHPLMIMVKEKKVVSKNPEILQKTGHILSRNYI